MTIVAAMDFSTVTDRVFEAASSLGESLRARIVLLHVVQPSQLTGAKGTSPEDVEEMIAAAEQVAARRLARYEKRLQLDKLSVSTALLRGVPAPQIVDRCVKLGASLLVMGSHGQGGATGRLVGSATEGVLRKAPCPVVIVPHPKTSRTRPPWL